MLYESAERYFQIENNMNIIVYVFYIYEEEMLFNGKYTYDVSNADKFILTNR